MSGVSIDHHRAYHGRVTHKPTPGLFAPFRDEIQVNDIVCPTYRFGDMAIDPDIHYYLS